MAVAIKKKSRPVVIKKVSEAKLQQMAQEALDNFKAASEERYERAKKVYDAQDNETKDALDRMIDLLSGIARKRMWVSQTRGSNVKAIVLLPDQVIRHNMFYMAVEILKDLAQMDVRIASFKFPEGLCLVCSNEIKPKKKRRK